jgi:hypothetical protein
MTTIACTLNEMSADTAVVNGGPLYHADKLFRVGVSILGTAGDGYMCLAFVEWFKSTRRSPQSLQKQIPIEHRDSIIVMELKPGGIYLWNGWGVPERIHEKFYAIGSGSMVAIAELTRGVSPADAVKAACRWDENTHAPIQTERLKRKRG